MKKILITGVAGFLGSHLAKELLFKGDKVVGIDNFSTGTERNVELLLQNELFTFFNCDVSKREVLEIEEITDCDEIYHLASPASPKFYQAYPIETILVNTVGTQNMLELAKMNKAKFLFTSTSEVYGDPEVHPQPETYRGNVHTWGPRACYDEAKRLGEVFCYEYFHRYEVEVKVVRVFNTYSAGLRHDDGRVISNLIAQALSGSDMTVYGDGSQTRTFCYVDDTIRALQMVMANKNATGEIINIGNSKEYSILEVAEMVKKLAETNSKITFHHPLPQDDPKTRRPDINKATSILGWYPEVNLEEGLLKTIEAYRKQKGKQEA